MVAGIVHGAACLMAVGGVLGWAAGRIVARPGLGIGAGVLGALSYYAMAPAMGYPAMFVSWMVVWILLAVCEGRLLQSARRPWLNVLARGAIAAVISGVAFYAISGTVWGPPPAGGRNYVKISPPGWSPGRRAFSRSAGRSASAWRLLT